MPDGSSSSSLKSQAFFFSVTTGQYLERISATGIGFPGGLGFTVGGKSGIMERGVGWFFAVGKRLALRNQNDECRMQKRHSADARADKRTPRRRGDAYQGSSCTFQGRSCPFLHDAHNRQNRRIPLLSHSLWRYVEQKRISMKFHNRAKMRTQVIAEQEEATTAGRWR